MTIENEAEEWRRARRESANETDPNKGLWERSVAIAARVADDQTNVPIVASDDYDALAATNEIPVIEDEGPNLAELIASYTAEYVAAGYERNWALGAACTKAQEQVDRVHQERVTLVASNRVAGAPDVTALIAKYKAEELAKGTEANRALGIACTKAQREMDAFVPRPARPSSTLVASTTKPAPAAPAVDHEADAQERIGAFTASLRAEIKREIRAELAEEEKRAAFRKRGGSLKIAG